MKIKFKEITDKSVLQDLGIEKEDYALLQTQESILSKKAYKKLLDDKVLKVGHYSIPLDFLQFIKDGSISEMQQQMHTVVDEKFIFAKEVVDVLMTGVELNKNIILWGRGGHGKSEITDLVLKTLYKEKAIPEPHFVQAFGDGLTDDKLFGGMDIKKYRSEGTIEYLPEFSFMNHEIVVFEEIFDAPASVLLALKDIMTSGYLRNGNQVFKSKTKVFIGLTNKSKAEFSEKSDSLKALAERFPLTLKVEWTGYSRSHFLKLFDKVFDKTFVDGHSDKLSTLANILDMNNTTGTTFVSPRTAVWAAEIYANGKTLDYISEIDKDVLAQYKKKKQDETIAKDQEAMISELEKYVNKHELELLDETEEFMDLLNEIELEAGGTPVETLEFDENLLEKRKVKLEKINYLKDVLDNVNFVQKHVQKAVDFKQRLNRMESNMLSAVTKAPKQESEDESSQPQSAGP